MKTFKALFIDQGTIKAGEFPVEPEKPILHPEDYSGVADYQYRLSQYRFALASAKANAVECEDQERALSLAVATCPLDAIIIKDERAVGVKDGIYRLFYGWDYRVENRIAKREDAPDFKVAILYRTDEQKDEPDWEAIIQLTLPESQEEIFDDLFSQYFKMLHEGHSMCKTGEILRERFTITRKP